MLNDCVQYEYATKLAASLPPAPTDLVDAADEDEPDVVVTADDDDADVAVAVEESFGRGV